MKCDFILTPEQQILVQDNLSVIGKTINLFIYPDEDVEGLGQDDLYQEGAMALCKAAATYDGVSAQFSTYATTVIRNHLYNCCKKANTRQRKLPSVSLDIDCSDEDQPPPFLEPSVPDGIDDLLERMDTAELLADCKRRYSGVARLGVEAMELQIRGLSGASIARMYRTTPNNVGAWVSRAKAKLRKDILMWSKKQTQ
ncbi:MAG: sigma-70 family RNA polymerase sigma factor [Oscillospiraceae bacterium]|nr:sigma-70 family RNA polymerase sigma factor [Oscillospiraceae bacterium]